MEKLILLTTIHFSQISVKFSDDVCQNRFLSKTFFYIWDSLVSQMVKHLPAMQKTGVPSLGQEDPLEKEKATHSSTLAWKIPWTEKTGSL